MADVCLFLLTHCPAYEKMAKAVAQGREYLRGEKGYRIWMPEGWGKKKNHTRMTLKKRKKRKETISDVEDKF